jgi:hypothetical protein
VKVTKEAKRLISEFLNRAAQVLFAMGVVGPFVAGSLRVGSAIAGFVVMAVFLIAAFFICLTIKEE